MNGPAAAVQFQSEDPQPLIVQPAPGDPEANFIGLALRYPNRIIDLIAGACVDGNTVEDLFQLASPVVRAILQAKAQGTAGSFDAIADIFRNDPTDAARQLKQAATADGISFNASTFRAIALASPPISETDALTAANDAIQTLVQCHRKRSAGAILSSLNVALAEDAADVPVLIQKLAENDRKLRAGAQNLEPARLSLREWLDRPEEKPDYLLGKLFHTKTRATLIAPTGLGKTNLAVAMAVAMAVGAPFLHWEAGRPCRVLYVDGEMSKRLLAKRLRDAVRRQDEAPDTFYVLCRDDVEDIPPLNTAAGQAYIDSTIEQLGGVDFIFFDNVQSLLVGDMKDEISWQDTLPWIKRLMGRNVGQCWIHHTGHEKSRGYGTSTRDWQLDTTLLMEDAEIEDCDIGLRLKFPKAREKDLENRASYEPAAITLANDRWTSEIVSGTPKSAPKAKLTPEEGAWLSDLVDLFATPDQAQMAVPSPGMASVLTLTREQAREGFKRKGRFVLGPDGNLTPKDRQKQCDYLNKLKAKRKIGLTNSHIWLLQEANNASG